MRATPGGDTPQPAWNQHRKRRRRLNRTLERSGPAIAAAIPQGRTRARRVSAWRDEALSHPRTATMTARSWRSWRAVVHAISNAIDPATMTTTFSWTSLAHAIDQADPQAATSRRSVARYLRMLHEAQLLGTVASGRCGRWAPKDNAGENDRAVYVLLITPHLAVVSEPVDRFGTPPLEQVGEHPRTHAREALALGEHPTEPLRGPQTPAAQARPSPLPAHRQPPAWPAGLTPSSKDSMLAASRALRHQLPPLRRISDRHVRSILRPFFLAGWTPADVVTAVDHFPVSDGWTPWPHDGAHGVTNVGAWFKHRLAAWRDATGTVRPSPSQRSRRRQAEAAARARARREQEARTRRGAIPRPTGHTDLAIRAIREALRTGQPVPSVDELGLPALTPEP